MTGSNKKHSASPSSSYSSSRLSSFSDFGTAAISPSNSS